MAVKGTLKSNGNEILIKTSQIEGLDNFNAATAQTATKAIQDGEGRNIYSTYATKEELANAELGTGSTSADEIYLRLDGGNKIKYNLKFESSVHGIVLGDGTNGFGFTDENEPVIVNNTGRYLNIAIDEFDGNYKTYKFPDANFSYNVATKEEIANGNCPLTQNTKIIVEDEQGSSPRDEKKISDFLELDNNDFFTGKVLKSVKSDFIEGKTLLSNGDDDVVTEISITKPGLYLCNIRGYYQGNYYYTCLIDVPFLTNESSIYSVISAVGNEKLTVMLDYEGSSKGYFLTLLKENLESTSVYNFRSCRCLMEY